MADKKKTAVIGIITGLANGLFGSGGGTVVVPCMEKYLDITPGSVSIMGLMNEHENKVQLLIDEDVMKEPYFGCHPCINTSSLKFTTDALKNKVIPALGHEPIMVKLPNPDDQN